MRANGLGVNRGTLCKITGISQFELSDFWAVCPYDFEGNEKRTRKREVVFWRNVGMFYAYMSGHTLESAGSIFNRDHATVIHGLKNVLTAYEGYGHIEIVDIINTINNHRLLTVEKSEDAGINFAISQVILDSMIGELI